MLPRYKDRLGTMQRTRTVKTENAIGSPYKEEANHGQEQDCQN